MAIQNRRGNEADFDPAKMVPGEWAVSLDTRYVRMCYAPGIVLRMATYEAFEADMEQIQSILAEAKSIQSAIKRIQSEVNSKAALTVEYAKSAEESADRAYEEAERAKIYAENASAVTGVSIATKDVAGLMRGGDNLIGEDGELILTKTTTDRTLYDSHAGGLKINEVQGESQQNSYTGKNLWNVSENSITIDANEQYSTPLGTVDLKKDEIVTVSCKQSVTLTTCLRNTFGYHLNGATKYQTASENYSLSAGVKTWTFTVPEDGTYNFFRWCNSPNVAVTYSDFQIELGDTPTDYEPYVGGTASPNLDYPQEIESVEVSQIKTVGKNLLKLDVDGRTNNGVTWTVDKTSGKITANGTAHSDANSLMTTISPSLKCGGKTIIFSADNGTAVIRVELLYLNNENVQQARYFQTNNPQTIYNINMITSVTFYVEKGDTVTNTTITPMIRLASIEDATYEPHQESVIDLSSPITLRGIGDAKDTIVKQDGVYGVLRNVKQQILSELNGASNISGECVQCYSWNFGGRKGLSGTHGLCDKFTFSASSDASFEHAVFNSDASNKNLLYFFIDKSRLSVSEETTSAYMAAINNWVASNNIEVVYPLATPVFEPLPVADQIALHQLETFGTVTHLSTDSTIKPVIESEYGVSPVGGYALDAWNTSKRNELIANDNANRLTALEALSTEVTE